MNKNLIVVGGGAGGPLSAAEAKRGDPSMNVAIIEQGEYVSYAARPMPYYIGDVIQDEKRMIARTPEQFEKTGVHVKLNTRVDEIDTEKG
jgi:Uncharacterized NAD(FAD)-dependent dehydrogenases